MLYKSSMLLFATEEHYIELYVKKIYKNTADGYFDTIRENEDGNTAQRESFKCEYVCACLYVTTTKQNDIAMSKCVILV